MSLVRLEGIVECINVNTVIIINLDIVSGDLHLVSPHFVCLREYFKYFKTPTPATIRIRIMVIITITIETFRRIFQCQTNMSLFLFNREKIHSKLKYDERNLL